MELLSWDFFIFSVIIIGIYYILNRKSQNIWLVIASVFYFCSWGWINLVPLLFIGSFSFLMGRKIEKEKKKQSLVIAILVIISILIIYRLLNSPIVNLNFQVTNSRQSDLINQLLLPIGFSFYSLQAISYLVDIYRIKIRPENDFFDFLLYLMYFPKVLAGPIERAGSFLPQLKNDRYVDNLLIRRGFYLIIVGLFRKLVIADILFSLIPQNYLHSPVINTHPSLGILSFPYFSFTDTVSYVDRLVSIIAYGIYLYNDFSGYTGIIRGVSCFLGIELRPNFQVPYFSSSLSDFWSRWHISLSSWLKDYIFFPLTRYLKKKQPGLNSILPVVIPIFVTMIVSSLWHSFSIPMIIWGLIYSFSMFFEQIIFRKFPKLRPQQLPLFGKIVSSILTFSIVTIAWVPFTAASTGEIFAFWKVLF